MDERLTREERLRRQAEIDACYRSGRRAGTRLLRVHVRPNDLAWSRLAVSVPGRLCDAVRRNRWKRLIREAFRKNKAEIGPGLDIVAIPGRSPEGLKEADVTPTLIDAVRRARQALER